MKKLAFATITGAAFAALAAGGDTANIGGVSPEAANAAPRSVRHKRADIADDRVLVRFVDGYRSLSEIPDLGVAHRGLRLLNPSAGSGGDIGDNIYVLMLRRKGWREVERALETLNANPAVAVAEPVYLRSR